MWKRSVTIIMTAAIAAVTSLAGNVADSESTPITITMEDCKASRRGRLDPEDLKDTKKLLEKLKRGWPQDELIKRGVIEVEGNKYSLYLPKARSYSMKNTAANDHAFENTSTLISIDQNGSGRLGDEDGWLANLPLRLGDRMFDLVEIAPDGGRIVLKPSTSPVRGLIVGRSCPAFSFKSSDGKTITREGLRGKVVVLDFWSVT